MITPPGDKDVTTPANLAQTNDTSQGNVYQAPFGLSTRPSATLWQDYRGWISSASEHLCERNREPRQDILAVEGVLVAEEAS